MAETGVDLGSPAVQKLKTPKVMMLVGMGVDSYQAGSLWHLFDTQVYMPITKLRLSHLPRVNLNEYTHIIMPSGNYQKALNEKMTKELDGWVKAGGHLIALQQAANWVEKHLIAESDDKTDQADASKKEAESTTRKAYGDYDADFAQRVLGGAIIAADADLTHPLAFGTHNKKQYVLMKGNAVLEPTAAKKSTEFIYNTPMQVAKEIKAAGYVSEQWLEKLANAPLVIAQKSGSGSIIRFGFNPNFRAFWYGTQRWMINAVFLADLIKKT